MKRILVVAILFSSCVNNEPDYSSRAAREITDADKAMSAQAAKEGFFKTLLAWADDSVIKPAEGQLPIIGKENLERHWSGKTDFTNLSWEPFRAEASKSGDLGYTIGNWKMIAPDT